MANDKQANGQAKPSQDDKAIIATIVANQSPTSDNSTALAEQQALLDAVKENANCVEITTGSLVGSTLVAFNETAKLHNRKEMSPQEWAELAIATGLLAIKRTWEYSAKTRNNSAYVEEMKVIAKLFTVPEPPIISMTSTPETHQGLFDIYIKRMTARFEAEQNCRAKYGVQ